MNKYINKIYKGGIIMYQDWFKKCDEIMEKSRNKDKEKEESKN